MILDILEKNDLIKNINNKLSGYRKHDKIILKKFPEKNINLKTLTATEAFNFIIKNNILECPICEDPIYYYNYIPWCIYQFSFDRIDNEKIHTLDNLKIVCYNCNARRSNRENYVTSKDNKCKFSCSRGCHIMKNDIH